MFNGGHLQLTKFCLVSMVLVVGCLGGCSSDAQVSGVVTFDTAPISDAQVIFVSEEEKGVGGLVAVTDAKGQYKLVGNSGSGVVPGKYRVSVTKMALQDGSDPAADPLEVGNEKSLLKNELPVIYGDRATTPLKAELVSGGNTINLDLKKQP